MSEAQLQSGAKPNVDTWGAFINGDFRPAASGKTFPTFNPGNGEVIAYLAESDEEDIEAAVRAALAAFPAWKRRAGAARAKLLMKLAQLVEANAAKLAELESLNAGKPIRDSKAIDAVTAVDALEYFAGMATKIQGDTIPVPGPYVNMTLREPLGVIGGIIPWNYPLLQAVWKIVPAIAAGNTVVLKPAVQGCFSGMYLGGLLPGAGVSLGHVSRQTARGGWHSRGRGQHRAGLRRGRGRGARRASYGRQGDVHRQHGDGKAHRRRGGQYAQAGRPRTRRQERGDRLR